MYWYAQIVLIISDTFVYITSKTRYLYPYVAIKCS